MHGAATSAPPPTPSTQQQSDNPMSTSAAADTLSRLLHRLPPTLSLPSRRAPPATCPPVPVISLSQARSNPSLLSPKLGFFQLTDHSIPPELADLAELEALSLFDLPKEKKEACFPRNWPVGFEEGDEVDEKDDDVDGLGESFCLDESCYTESDEMSLASLSEFARALEKLGLEVIELLCRSVGFESPLGNKGDDPSPTRFCSMMWVAEGLSGKSKTPVAGRFYPYVVGLQYQIKSGRKYSLLTDSGLVSVVPQVQSVLVTIGDIAQVWSNGELKKVRGMPVAHMGEGNKFRGKSMSLLVTLPIDTTICPLLPAAAIIGGNCSHKDDDDQNGTRNNTELGDHQINDSITCDNREMEGRVFKSFCLEDYAWRVYHERLHFKDPLDRFRIKN